MVDLLYDFPGISSLSGSSMRILWNPSISMIWMRSRKSNSEVIFWNSWILNISYFAPSQCSSRSLKSNSFERLGSRMFGAASFCLFIELCSKITSLPEHFLLVISSLQGDSFFYLSRCHDHLHNLFPNIQTKTHSVHSKIKVIFSNSRIITRK